MASPVLKKVRWSFLLLVALPGVVRASECLEALRSFSPTFRRAYPNIGMLPLLVERGGQYVVTFTQEGPKVIALGGVNRGRLIPLQNDPAFAGEPFEPSSTLETAGWLPRSMEIIDDRIVATIADYDRITGEFDDRSAILYFNPDTGELIDRVTPPLAYTIPVLAPNGRSSLLIQPHRWSSTSYATVWNPALPTEMSSIDEVPAQRALTDPTPDQAYSEVFTGRYLVVAHGPAKPLPIGAPDLDDTTQQFALMFLTRKPIHQTLTLFDTDQTTAEGEVPAFAHFENTTANYAISSDERYLAFASSDARLIRVAYLPRLRDNPIPEWELNYQEKLPNKLIFSPTNSSLLLAEYEDCAVLWKLRGLTPNQTTTEFVGVIRLLPGERFSDVNWSGDGALLALSTVEGAVTYLLSAENGLPIGRLSGSAHFEEPAFIFANDTRVLVAAGAEPARLGAPSEGVNYQSHVIAWDLNAVEIPMVSGETKRRWRDGRGKIVEWERFGNGKYSVTISKN